VDDGRPSVDGHSWIDPWDLRHCPFHGRCALVKGRTCVSLESPPRWLESLQWHPGFVRVAHRPQRAERRSPGLIDRGTVSRSGLVPCPNASPRLLRT
jgi:hypothetical protein